MTRLAFLASHNGSSARAIVQACADGRIPARPLLMISNNPGCGALQWAGEAGLECLVINARTHTDPDTAIAETLRGRYIDLVCCSGYMKLIGPQTIAAMKGNILNVHPALLPAYGGQGMYGRHIHEAVAAAQDTRTGITIHLVDGEYDHGKIVAQKILPLNGDTADSIEAKVKAAEPDFYVETLAAFVTSDRRA